MSQFWYTVAGRQFIEGTMPEIARNLDRIATALENRVLAQAAEDEEDTIREYPRCEWCDHRHLPTTTCLVDDCECQH